MSLSFVFKGITGFFAIAMASYLFSSITLGVASIPKPITGLISKLPSRAGGKSSTLYFTSADESATVACFSAEPACYSSDQ